ncbi:hypothetical protein ASF69_01555 [Rhizobium sp. Leaf311]|uniref:hypothetical protein n=1 Tax=Rhizobium sp. Leaf311 TaxID=1736332 RepID=UPI00071301A3|nr:hypothetical protein [Rhizobium sp. Leaf311]KQQ61136.1 hypothetical protein ASF69_01555 [Rhizobium sp. Leaf311]
MPAFIIKFHDREDQILEGSDWLYDILDERYVRFYRKDGTAPGLISLTISAAEILQIEGRNDDKDEEVTPHLTSAADDMIEVIDRLIASTNKAGDIDHGLMWSALFAFANLKAARKRMAA